MKITKRLVAASAALTLALGGTAMAANVTVDVTQGGSGNASSTGTLTPGVNTNVSEQEFGAQGHTTVSIMEAGKVATQNISFEVPLYVTMAVITNDANVKVPSNYQIKNTAADPAANPIGVTQMYFEKLQSSTFNTVTSGALATSGNQAISLKIAQLEMPALNTPSKVPVTITDSTTFKNGGNVVKIEAAPLTIPLEATVNAATRTDKDAVPQFKVQYVVSPIDTATGKPLGIVYAGDSSIDAGIGQWTTNGFQKATP